MEMRALYNVSLPLERDDSEDRKTHEDVKKRRSRDRREPPFSRRPRRDSRGTSIC